MLLLETYVFGLMLGIAIGPIALLILNVSLKAGARAGFACAAGATTADLLFAMLAFHLANQIVPALQAHEVLLQILASLVLLLFALHMLWQLRRAATTTPAAAHGAHRYFFGTLLLTIVNPLTVLAFASYATQTASAMQTASASVMAVLAALGTGTVAIALVLGANGLRTRLTRPQWLRSLNAVSALGILLFALRGLWLTAMA